MLNFYYINNNNDILPFYYGNVWSDPNQLRGYEWELTASNGVYTSINRKAYSREIDVYFSGDTKEEALRTRNHAYEVFEHDVLEGIEGRLVVGTYTLRCFVSGIADECASVGECVIKSRITIESAYPVWTTGTAYQFMPTEELPYGGFDFPFDFSVDFAAKPPQTITNPYPFPSHFQLTFYGSTSVAPSVTIGGMKYGVTGVLNAGESVVIDSQTRTVEMVKGNTMDVTSWFGKRTKDNSIFAKIPPGVSTLEWSGNFGFDLTIFNERSEPTFEEIT